MNSEIRVNKISNGANEQYDDYYGFSFFFDRIALFDLDGMNGKSIENIKRSISISITVRKFSYLSCIGKRLFFNKKKRIQRRENEE